MEYKSFKSTNTFLKMNKKILSFPVILKRIKKQKTLRDDRKISMFIKHSWWHGA